jgi:hypothetical protein
MGARRGSEVLARAPAAPSARAMAFPMPREEPVTMHTGCSTACAAQEGLHPQSRKVPCTITQCSRVDPMLQNTTCCCNLGLLCQNSRG